MHDRTGRLRQDRVPAERIPPAQRVRHQRQDGRVAVVPGQQTGLPFACPSCLLLLSWRAGTGCLPFCSCFVVPARNRFANFRRRALPRVHRRASVSLDVALRRRSGRTLPPASAGSACAANDERRSPSSTAPAAAARKCTIAAAVSESMLPLSVLACVAYLFSCVSCCRVSESGLGGAQARVQTR